MKPRVLIVDDDDGVRYTIAGILEDHDVDVAQASGAQEALSILDGDPRELPSLVITDLRMPGMSGLELLDRIVARTDPPKVVLITAHGSERLAVDAVKRGAYDYFRKPFDMDELVAVVDRALESVRLRAQNEQLEGELALRRTMVFESPQMRRLAVLVRRVAPRDVTVLIRGESGTGKEKLAEAIVAASRRAQGSFVRFNCAALSPELADAELFGHAKGAYTGAHRARSGLFREADGGTIFLDEVGELALNAQAKLLRVLQEREVRPVGDDRPMSVDVRVLAATHRNLESEVEAGRFREDLYYRLKVVVLELPPLRERPSDIPALTESFLRTSAQRMGVRPVQPTAELTAALQRRTWPGNVRELANEIESLVALSEEGTLDLSALAGVTVKAEAVSSTSGTLKARMDAFERELLERALAQADGNRTEAAKSLGIGRATLHDKLRKHGL
ncbi:MAG: sigma-54 dependent transcriptional regulator [Nannocystaceae bacterium]|nr:sigma-54 dependent transcriptional regulator [Nannocystaceae bacterium]